LPASEVEQCQVVPLMIVADKKLPPAADSCHDKMMTLVICRIRDLDGEVRGSERNCHDHDREG
jgi:hypothetical protein